MTPPAGSGTASAGRHPHAARSERGAGDPLRGFVGVFRYSRRAVELVWSTSHGLTIALGLLTLVAGILPAGIAWVGANIVDAVVAAAGVASAAGMASADTRVVIELVILEGLLVAALAAAQRALGLCQSLLRAQLGQRVNVMILEKAVSLTLAHFEDSEFYDKLTRARREASSRPLSLVMRTFGLLQNAISLVSYGVLLVKFSPWAVAVLLLAGLPAFIAEAKFSGDAFRLFRWRSPETRMQLYLETVLAREDYAKEVKLYGLGARLLQRYRDIFDRLYREDRAPDHPPRQLGLRPRPHRHARTVWGLRLDRADDDCRPHHARPDDDVPDAVPAGPVGSVGESLGDRRHVRGQSLPLDTVRVSRDPRAPPAGRGAATGPTADGVRFEDVGFTYPGADRPALEHVTLHLKPGTSLALVGENGSGKTTLIKLLTRLYDPTQGRVLLEGRDLREWDEGVLRARIGVIFQDFARYQMLVGENIGAGDEPAFEDEARWREAAGKGRAEEFIETLPAGYQTQLGKWFKDGRELSGGQWQKIALSRAFMRMKADILVLDEPTAAMDAQAEAEVFEHFRQLASERIAILISHRFSTVRMADQIVVIDDGRIAELGSHEQLMQLDGVYARLFALQARGYRCKQRGQRGGRSASATGQ